jgi:hypothetical protein
LVKSQGAFSFEDRMSLWPHKPPPPYVHQEYPKFVGDKIVHSAEEEAALLKASKTPRKRTEADKS